MPFIGKGGPVDAILFQPARATGTDAAGIDHAADSGEIARLELRHFAARLYDTSDDFVAGTRVDRVAPLVANLMQVGMAYPQ